MRMVKLGPKNPCGDCRYDRSGRRFWQGLKAVGAAQSGKENVHVSAENAWNSLCTGDAQRAGAPLKPRGGRAVE
jgi:hypothetical protein